MKLSRSKLKDFSRIIFARDRGICSDCGLDTEALRYPIYQRKYRNCTWQMKRNDYEIALIASGESKLSALKNAHRLADEWAVDGFEDWPDPKRRWWEIDHITPLVYGGKHEQSNLRTLCHRCHKTRTSALLKKLISERKGV